MPTLSKKRITYSFNKTEGFCLAMPEVNSGKRDITREVMYEYFKGSGRMLSRVAVSIFGQSC
jgi:hypothetical protein